MARSNRRPPTKRNRSADFKKILAGVGLGSFFQDTFGSLVAHIIRDAAGGKVEDMVRNGVLPKEDADKAFERLSDNEKQMAKMRIMQLEGYAKALEEDTSLSHEDKERMIKQRSEELMANAPERSAQKPKNSIEGLIKTMDPRNERPEVRKGFRAFWRKLPAEQRAKLIENADKLAPTLLADALELMPDPPTLEEVFEVYEEAMSTFSGPASSPAIEEANKPKNIIDKLKAKDISGALDDAVKTLPPKLPPMQLDESKEGYWKRIKPRMEHLRRRDETDEDFKQRFDWVVSRALKDLTFQKRRRGINKPFTKR